MSHLLNLFQVADQDKLSLSYRLARIGGLPTGKTLYENLQRVAKFVAREHGTPAVVLNRDGMHYLAVGTAPTKKPLLQESDVPVLQGLSARVCLEDEEHHIRGLADLQSDDDRRISVSFMSFALRGHLMNAQGLWQGGSRYTYYTKTPVRSTPVVSVYPGFSYRVRWVPGNGLCVAVDIVHTYVDVRTLAQRMAAGSNWQDFRRRYFLYEMGPSWFFIQLQEVLDQPVCEARFEYPKGSGTHVDVYSHTCEYVRNRGGTFHLPLNPTDRALVFNYSDRKEPLQAATSLARLHYQTDDLEAKRVHSVAVLSPENRLSGMQQAIREHFDGRARLEGTLVRVIPRPLQVPREVFPVPNQLFGNDKVLRTPSASGRDIKEMWRTRVSWLHNPEIGFFNKSGLSSQFILMPASVAREEALADRIKDDLSGAVGAISPVEYTPNLILWDDESVRTVLDLKAALERGKRQMEQSGLLACCLVVLPPRWSGKRTGTLRRHMKKLLHPSVRTKCVQIDEMLEYLEAGDDGYEVVNGKDTDYQKYLFNAALDLLVTSGHWPWVLADPLHYDLYVGVDVLNNAAGFTFVGLGGAVCRFQAVTTEQKEKIAADQMKQVLTPNIADLSPRIQKGLGRLPQHLILVRDGRLYDSEWEGLEAAVAELQLRGRLPDDVQLGAIEIHKSQAEHLRMMSTLDGRPVNPIAGSYRILDDTTGLLCTTGFPGLPRGTAEPLVARIVRGDLDMRKALEDEYRLSVLAWTKPDGLQSNPLVIKLADMWLEPIGASTKESDDIAEPADDDNEDLSADGD